jgi:hypothetical protein
MRILPDPTLAVGAQDFFRPPKLAASYLTDISASAMTASQSAVTAAAASGLLSLLPDAQLNRCNVLSYLVLLRG